MKKLMLTMLFTLAGSLLFGADYYVDVNQGQDRNPGTKAAPWKQVNRSISRLKAGDTLHILPSPTPIQGYVLVRGIVGTAEKPVTIDCMNNIFDGTRPLKPADWKLVSPGLYKQTRTLGRSMAARYFMLVNGKQQRMGRFVKGSGSAAYKAPEKLLPGEWTIVDSEPKNRKQHNFDFYIRLADKAPQADIAKWSEPYQTNGIAFRGKCRFVNLRNAIVRYYWSDGFNFHQDIRNVLVENIAAIGCGDDGLSAHEKALITVRKYVAVGNSSGICHVGQAECIHDQIYIEKTMGSDILMIQDTVNTMNNVWISGDSYGGFNISNQSGQFAGKNILCVNHHKRARFTFRPKPQTKVTLDNVRIAGYRRVQAPAEIQKISPSAQLDAELAAKRKEFFAMFGGNLEKALK